MAYKNCKKVIENKKAKLKGEEYETFKSDMTDKLDVFLLNNRITKDEYNELIALM